jgi:hypothetical protein
MLLHALNGWEIEVDDLICLDNLTHFVKLSRQFDAF